MIITALASLFALACPLTASAGDRTDAELADLRADGLELVRHEVLPDGVSFNLFITSAAQALARDHEFDAPDDRFKLETFGQYVSETFRDSLGYFDRIVGGQPVVHDLNVVIEDKGDERKETISEAVVGSRIIALDLRRWDKIRLGHRPYLASLTSIHEFTHVATYQFNPAETKKHRELVAITVECLNFVRRYGARAFETSYLRSVPGPLDDRGRVLGENYHGNDALRWIAHSFVSKILDGSYAVKDTDRMRALERFAAAYVESGETGARGFDDALKIIGATDPRGGALTLDRIQNDLYAELDPKAASPAGRHADVTTEFPAVAHCP